MDKILIVDTNVLVGLWQNNKETLKILPTLKKYTIGITIFTYVEFLAAAPLRLKASTRKFLNRFFVIPFSTHAIQAAKTFAYSKETPQRQFVDLLIASNIKGGKYKFLTYNLKDFKDYELDLL